MYAAIVAQPRRLDLGCSLSEGAFCDPQKHMSRKSKLIEPKEAIETSLEQCGSQAVEQWHELPHTTFVFGTSISEWNTAQRISNRHMGGTKSCLLL